MWNSHGYILCSSHFSTNINIQGWGPKWATKRRGCKCCCCCSSSPSVIYMIGFIWIGYLCVNSCHFFFVWEFMAKYRLKTANKQCDYCAYTFLSVSDSDRCVIYNQIVFCLLLTPRLHVLLTALHLIQKNRILCLFRLAYWSQYSRIQASIIINNLRNGPKSFTGVSIV